MERFIKLVRDRIGDHLEDDGRIVYKPITDEDVNELRRKKLVEEALEYLMDPSIEELADVLEALRACLMYEQEEPWAVLTAVAAEKREQRGGFDMGVGMYLVTSAGKFS
jgi:predicted house-cleaning noncanonical NTP pyrophosphatase (MazG superfamily)